ENKKLQEEEVKVLKKQKKSNTNNEDDNTAKASATNTNLKMPENLKFEPKQPGTVKFVSYNVAGLNASLKKGFKNYIEAEDPDILCLEETKVSKEVDGAIDYKKYQYYWWGINETKKGHGGISVFSKIKPISSTLGLPTHPNPEITKGNIITLEFPELYYVACYVPNAGSKLVKLNERMGWDAAMEKYLRQLDEKKPVIWAGDLNVAHKEIDLTNPDKNHKTAGFTPEERGNFEKILNGGGDNKFVDTWRHFHPNALGCYTYYSYRYQCRSKNIGWRLDYHVVSERILDRVVENEEDFLNSSNSSNRQLDSNSPGFHKLRPSDTQGYIKTNIHDDSTRPDYMISPLENGLRDSMSTLKKHPYEGYSSLWKGQFATWLYEIGYLYFQPNLEGKLNETFDLYDDTIPLIYLDHATPNVVTKVASHLIVGVLLSPLEIVRTRLIVQSSSPSHKKYNGTFNCLSQIIREEGFSSLYWSHNLLPSIVYHTVVPLLQCTRDLFIERIFHISPTESPILFGFAQFGLSTLQLIITLPLETIRKRLQCQIKTRKPGRPFKTIVQTRQAHYFGMLDATYRIVLEEGISQKYVSDNDGTSHPSLNKLKRNKRRQRGWLDNYGIGNLYQGFYMHLTMNFATFLFQVVNGNEDEYDDI
ncbi:7754_t:CDS:2, partial [Entrophospora sp. SA101]